MENTEIKRVKAKVYNQHKGIRFSCGNFMDLNDYYNNIEIEIPGIIDKTKINVKYYNVGLSYSIPVEIKKDQYFLLGNNGPYSIDFSATVLVRVITSERTICSFKIGTLYTCCGIAVASNFNINYPYNNHDLYKFFNKLKEDLCKVWGYSTILCTERDHNKVHKKLMKRNKYKIINSFTNIRTENKINIFIKKIEYTQEEIYE